jgi:hypothetical protein
MQIGAFTRSNDGSFTGSIKTLAFDVEARLVPSDPAPASDPPEMPRGSKFFLKGGGQRSPRSSRTAGRSHQNHAAAKAYLAPRSIAADTSATITRLAAVAINPARTARPSL